jgi:hypothetical protein
MNESGWLKSGEPHAMLDAIEGKVSDRKLRLFACACCRAYWTYFTDKGSRLEVEVAQRFADGQATAAELARSHDAALLHAEMFHDDPDYHHNLSQVYLAFAVTLPSASEAVRETLRRTLEITRQYTSYADIPGFDARRAEADAMRDELWDQCELLRHIVGNPFRPVAVDPAWLRWNGGAVVKMAQAIYDENRFDDLPFLADALTDAGCDNEEILTHCRTPMEHPRGCWVVDALLPPSTQRQQVLE